MFKSPGCPRWQNLSVTKELFLSMVVVCSQVPNKKINNMHVVSFKWPKKRSSSVCQEMVTFYSKYQLQHHNQRHMHLVYMTLEWSTWMWLLGYSRKAELSHGVQFGLSQFSLNTCGITVERLLPLPPKEFGLFIGDFLTLQEAKLFPHLALFVHTLHLRVS